VVVSASTGEIVLVNAQAERMFGYPREELLGRAVETLVPERFQAEHVAHRARYFARPGLRPMGARLQLFGRRKDGSEFPVEISLSPLQTEEGLLATSVIRDVSVRKREEAKFRTLVENIPAVTFIAPLDENTPELYVSPQIEEMLGFTQKEWLEDPVLWHRQLHPADRERWNRHFAPTCASGEPFDSAYRFLAKDGRVVWVHGSARMVRDAEGRLLFLQGVAFDITSIKEAEEALREQARLALLRADVGAATTSADALPGMLLRCAQALTHHLDVGSARVWTFNEDDQTLELQAAAGQDSEPAGARVPLGQGPVGLIARRRRAMCSNPPDGEPHAQDWEWERRAGLTAFAGYPLLIEDHLVGVLAASSRRPFSQAAFQSLELAAGQIALGIERRGAEEKLRRINAELERRVDERTDELRRSMAELQDKTQELEKFAYVASHDLSQPLRTLVNFPQLLGRDYRDKLDEKGNHYVNKTISGAERMQRLIENLLQYSRVVRRERVFGPTDCALSAQEACANLQAAIDESGAQVRVSELPTVLGNPQQLMLLFQNLIGNGIKFRDPARPVRVEVGARPQDGHWLFWVRDNGIGIEARYLKQIFGLGERLYAASRYPGTGYGLHICEKIAAGHGGRIWAESEVGQGSTFFFTLPDQPAGK
jgi:PAS domain S-box-containing protein